MKLRIIQEMGYFHVQKQIPIINGYSWVNYSLKGLTLNNGRGFETLEEAREFYELCVGDIHLKREFEKINVIEEHEV